MKKILKSSLLELMCDYGETGHAKHVSKPERVKKYKQHKLQIVLGKKMQSLTIADEQC